MAWYRDPDSSLPYLVRILLEGGIIVNTRESSPWANRAHCHPLDYWPERKLRRLSSW